MCQHLRPKQSHGFGRHDSFNTYSQDNRMDSPDNGHLLRAESTAFSSLGYRMSRATCGTPRQQSIEKSTLKVCE